TGVLVMAAPSLCTGFSHGGEFRVAVPSEPGMTLTPLRLDPVTSAADAPVELERELDAHRRELTGYCYRMLGSGFEAEDAVQETLIRAWKNFDSFEGRSAVRSWLYRIATNVCLDMLRSPQRRARPMDFGPPVHADHALGPLVPEHEW